MAVGPERQRRPKRAEVRRRLLDAAFGVFAQRGYAEATLDELAARAGFSKGAVYSNFVSKEEVFYALLRERVGERIEQVHRAVDSTQTLRGAALAAGRVSGDLVNQESDWHLLFLEFVTRSARDPAPSEELAHQRKKLRRLVASEVRQQLAALDVEPSLSAEQLAVVLLALSNGLAVEQLADPTSIDPHLFERTMDLIAVGLQHSSSSAESNQGVSRDAFHGDSDPSQHSA